MSTNTTATEQASTGVVIPPVVTVPVQPLAIPVLLAPLTDSRAKKSPSHLSKRRSRSPRSWSRSRSRGRDRDRTPVVLDPAIVQLAITIHFAKVEWVWVATEDLIEVDLGLHCHRDVRLHAHTVLDVSVLRFLHPCRCCIGQRCRGSRIKFAACRSPCCRSSDCRRKSRSLGKTL